MILAIDPGPEESGWVKYEPGAAPAAALMDCGVMQNDEMLGLLLDFRARRWATGKVLAVEMIQSYGMPVGQEVFDTCVWIGRFVQAWHAPDDAMLVFRQDVKLRLCGQPRAKDANVRRALLDLFPRTGGGAVRQVGTAKSPGPLFGMSSHAWPALGVAIVAADRIEKARAAPRRKLNL